MSSSQHFAILLVFIAACFSVLGFFLQRFVTKQDQRWQRVDELILSDSVDRAERPSWVARIERLESALTKLSEIVAEMGLAQARHEGYHERHDPHEESRIGGRERNR